MASECKTIKKPMKHIDEFKSLVFDKNISNILEKIYFFNLKNISILINCIEKEDMSDIIKEIKEIIKLITRTHNKKKNNTNISINDDFDNDIIIINNK